MTLPWFYEKNITASASSIFLSEETSRHCIQVLRMRAGAQLQLTDGTGNLYTATIISDNKKNCTVSLSGLVNILPAKRKITMAVSLLKNVTRLEWFIEKAAEIGISTILPLICERTEKQKFRQERMQSILISAMLQSRQTWLTVLQEPVPFSECIKAGFQGQKFIAHCDEGIKQNFSSLLLEKDIQMLIGPEGDFSPGEISLALSGNYIPVSLGATRLRTETAALVAATLLVNN